jgi:general secretion pathway protein I
MRLPSRSSVRPGVSLLEVLVALAVFMISIGAIIQLINTSADLSLEISERGEAGRLAQSKLAEVIAGIVPLSSQSDQAFDEDPENGWSWSLDAEQGDIPNLWNVTVSVSRTRQNGDEVKVSLSQMVLDPSVRGGTMDTTSSSSGGSGGTSSGSSGGTSGR